MIPKLRELNYLKFNETNEAEKKRSEDYIYEQTLNTLRKGGKIQMVLDLNDPAFIASLRALTEYMKETGLTSEEGSSPGPERKG